MFINSLHADLWVSRADKGLTLDRPSWEDIERAVRQLNGNERASLILQRFTLVLYTGRHAGTSRGCPGVSRTVASRPQHHRARTSSSL